MESKILCVTKDSVNKGTQPFTGNNITDAVKITECYEFKNSISTTDNYRIFVDTRYANNLVDVFEKLAADQDPDQTVTFDIAKRIKSNTDYYIRSQQPENSVDSAGIPLLSGLGSL
jgi:hypothetical protein